MIRTKKYATSVSVSAKVIIHTRLVPRGAHRAQSRRARTTETQAAQSFNITDGPERRQQTRMNPDQLHTIIQGIARGEIDAADAHARLLEMIRARPFEDLGFARVDHHRASRQGFPEVVLGLGKTPA